MESEIEVINRMRCALEYDFWIIDECLQVFFAFDKGRKENIVSGEIYKNKDYAAVDRVIMQSIDHAVIIHFWNIVGGNVRTCKHNIRSYCERIENNLDQWVESYYKNTDADHKMQIKRDIQSNISELVKHIDHVKSIENNLYDRVHNWRDNVFAHFDDDTNPGSMYVPLLNDEFVKLREAFIKNNHIEYSELDLERESLYKIFTKINKVSTFKDYEIPAAAKMVMKYMVEMSKSKTNNA
jgi:hypothetical protein